MKNSTYIILALVVLAACRSHKELQTTPEEALTEVAEKSKLKQTSSSAEEGTKKSIRGTVAKLKLRLEGGDKSLSCGGTYRSLEGDVVQLNLVYSVFVVSINVGTLELTRDSVLIVDRVNKRYCRAAYREVPELRKANIDIEHLQSLATTEPIELQLTPEYTATISLSKFEESTDWPHRTEVPDDYTRVPWKAVINALMSAAK